MGINWGRALMTGTSGALDNRRALEIAERLRVDAEARDLAMRRTLAEEAGARQISLQELTGAQALERQVSSDKTTLQDRAMGNRQAVRSGGSDLGVLSPGASPAEQMLINSQERARRQAIAELRAKAESDALVGSRNRSNVPQPRAEGVPTVEFRSAGDSLLAMTKNPDGSWASEVVDVPGGGKPKDNAQVFKDYQRAISDEVDLLYKDYELRTGPLGTMEPEEFPTNAEIVKAATKTVKERMDLLAGGRTAVLSPGLSPGGTGGISVQEAQAMWENTGN